MKTSANRTKPGPRWVWQLVQRWVDQRKDAQKKRDCENGEHDWRCANEIDSMMTPVCEMEGMPLICPDCKATATAHWKPGEGLTCIKLTPLNKQTTHAK